MPNPTTIAQDYLALWNDDDDASRQARLSGRWAASAVYADPLMAASGRNEIAEMIVGARQTFPGHTFSLRGTPDGHSRFVRFSWTLAPADGTVVARGTDIVRLDEEDRFVEVIGFLDGSAV